MLDAGLDSADGDEAESEGRNDVEHVVGFHEQRPCLRLNLGASGSGSCCGSSVGMMWP